MSMNLVKIANLLKDASDQNLIQEMQNPSGSVPSYMVLSELQRRKKLRGSLMNDEPQTSVAEDHMAQAAPAQMGLGALQQSQAAPQAPVGMASGGEVKHYFAGDMVTIGGRQYEVDPATGKPLVNGIPTDPTLIEQSANSPWNSKKGMAYPSFTEGLGGDLKSGAIKTAAATADVIRSPLYAIDRAFGSPFMDKSATPFYDKYVRQAGLDTPPTAAPVKPAAADMSKYQNDPNYIEALTGKRPGAAPAGANTGANTGAGTNTGSAAPSTASGSMSPYLEELKGYRKDLADAYKNQSDIYKQQADEIKNAKSSDVALALMQAGFGIMGGRSQYAAENIGQGAMPAIQQYAGMDRARREQLQKLALGEGALGIESLRARMEGAKGEGELGLKERAVAADETKARAAMQSAGAQSSYYKQMIANAKTENDAAKIAASVINSQGFAMMDPTDQKFFLGMAKQGLMNRFPGVGGSTGPSVPTYNPQTRSWQ